MYFGCVFFKDELGFLNYDDICMFVFIMFMMTFLSLFTAGYVSLCCVSSHVVVFGLSVRLSWYLCGCGGCCDCDACTVVCVAWVYAESVSVTEMLVWLC